MKTLAKSVTLPITAPMTTPFEVCESGVEEAMAEVGVDVSAGRVIGVAEVVRVEGMSHPSML